ncbi:two-component response regulator [Lachnospiraceae bacterium KM106-2]|nr:two-component response regulator [Lachnospiraceae bacterium KM106-2]
MTIAICEDEDLQIQLLKKYINEWLMLGNKEARVVTYQSGEEFLFQFEEEMIDILLLDIEMPGINGMELAKRLRAKRVDVQIIFETGNSEYVFDGYAVEAISYLIKPINKIKLSSCLEQAWNRCNRSEPSMLIEDNEGIRKVYLKEISYIESVGHDTYIHIKKEEYRNKKGIREVSKEVESMGFIMPHRSYLVNLPKVEQITKKELLLDGGERIPIARGKWAEVNQAYLHYYRR